MQTNEPLHNQDPREDFNEFFHQALCGYVVVSPDGVVERINQTLASWLGEEINAVEGKRISDLFSIGGKIYYETHLWPLLRMQGYFDEVALELQCISGEKLPVIINALERKSNDNTPSFIRITVFKAKDRRTYEQNLKLAKLSLEQSLANALEISVLKEQFMAILGHDLRNPLGSIIAGITLLSSSQSLDETDRRVIEIIRKSSSRMSELIANIMDFARTRMGDGLVLTCQPTMMEPVLTHVIDELQSIWPERIIKTDIVLSSPINCDPPRIAQLLSNLISNAITHGSEVDPIQVNAHIIDGKFKIAVCNTGNPIAPENIDRLFEPFTRETAHRSQNGLGLGLYISLQISKAHKGELTVTSTEEETCFTFSMSLGECKM